MDKINPDIIRLQDILQMIAEIEKINASNKKTTTEVFAVAYCVAVIGEAANNLSGDFRKENDGIEWHKIIGTRHKIIHDYGKLHEPLLWEIVNTHLPILKEQITSILDKLRK